jgi:tRNA dimethylallyltransferase
MAESIHHAVSSGLAPEAYALVGPTASGKTALALAVAERVPVEIVSMDSRQVYRGMDVGTAKPSATERSAVPHHGIDLVDPDTRFSAAEFARLARRLVPEIRARGRIPLLVGGTGFFLWALTHPIFREPPLDPERRARLAEHLRGLDDAALHAWLAALDPETAARLRHWGGRQRLLRALELPLLTGRPLSWWHRNSPPEAPPMDVRTWVLDVPRELLDRTIDARVGAMVGAGLEAELRALIARGLGPESPGLRAHGYQELLPYLRGETTLEQALDEVRRATRAYARRQRTWFRNQVATDTVWLDGLRPRAALAHAIAGGIAHMERWGSVPVPNDP